MPTDAFLAFVAASAALLIMPGPNVSLIVGASVAHGTRHGLLTVLGTSSAMVLQLGVTTLGMATLMTLLAEAFAWLRWLGVAYLVYLGVRTWHAVPTGDPSSEPAVGPLWRATYVRGLLVSLTNPKTLLFYGAFLPQFARPGAEGPRDLFLLSCTFVAMAVMLDGTWALLAGRARPLLRTRQRLQQRVTGGLLVGAGVGLAFARKP